MVPPAKTRHELWDSPPQKRDSGKAKCASFKWSIWGSFPNCMPCAKLESPAKKRVPAAFNFCATCPRMRWIANTLAPRHCAGCGLWLVDSTDWPDACDVCSAAWPDLRGSEGSVLFRERCAAPYGVTGFRLRSDPYLRAQIHEMKYGGNRFLAARWGRWLGETHGRPEFFNAKETALVPVPMHWKKRLRRGYNQAFWIAWGVSKAWDLPLRPDLLKRAYHESSLTRLSRIARSNRSKALYTSKPQSEVKAAVVVDDVLTTGSTMLACGVALERNGIRWDGAMTLALA